MEKLSFISERLKLEPCPIGKSGFCCKMCLMGPCRVVSNEQKGVCGASRDLIVSRNILRFVSAGTAAHCGHAYHLLQYLKKPYKQNYIKAKAPAYLYKLWDELGIVPKVKLEHFKEISEALHATTMGTNSDYRDVLKWCMKLGIIDGYYGLYLATELEDKKFGRPKIQKGKLNLGVLNPSKVNIAVHGHEPMLAEALIKEARKHKDINVVGVCCTGASMLNKHGIPWAANFILQENVIATGILDAMVVDVQCIMPSLADLAECFHTKLITTNEIARIPNALHLPIKNEVDSKKAAKRVIQIAKENKKNRINKKADLSKRAEAVVGFSEHNINAKRIAEQIKNKRIKGVIAAVGCVNPRINTEGWIEAFKELSKDYLILTTGCIAFEFDARNLLDGKRFFHMGSCVNNSRVAEVFKMIAKHLNKNITDLPFLVSCPMPITEKAVAIAFFFASIGVDVHIGYPFLIASDTNVAFFLENVLKEKFKSRIFLDTEPQSFYRKII